MDPSKILAYFSYAMAVIFLAMGSYILFFFPQEFNVPENFRLMFGAVVFLYGVYRIVSLRIKQRQSTDDEE